jgi:hypothetical protein
VNYGPNARASPQVIAQWIVQQADGLASAHHHANEEVDVKGEQPVVTVKVAMEPEGLKRIKEEGKLVAFVDALPLMAAGSIKAAVVEMLAEGELAGPSVAFRFVTDDFGTPPPPGPWPGPLEGPAVVYTMLSVKPRVR